MLLMYEAEIRVLKKDLQAVKSVYSKEAKQNVLDEIIGQYEFSKKMG